MRRKVKLMFIIFALFLFLIGIPTLLFFNKYGDLNDEQEIVINKWSQVDFLYQKRLRSIREVMDTLSGHAPAKEQLILCIAEREQYLKTDFVHATGNQDSLYEQAQAEITDAIQEFLVQVSDSNQTLLHSQDQMNNHIYTARYDYNEAVRKFNTHIHHFPSRWVARVMGMKDKNYFESKP